MKNWIFLLVALFFFGCKNTEPKTTTAIPKIEKEENNTIIAFGSCADQDREPFMWKYINANQPNLWIWLGDNIYGDSDDPSDLKREYEKQNAHEDYQKLKATCPIIGTWDDHDYGINNGGKEWSIKAAAQRELLDFLEVSASDPRRNREGVYSAYTFGEAGKSVKVILLDCRYFRDSSEIGANKQYILNETGTVLGETQWNWLENELTNSTTQVHIIGSGIQVIPEEHRFEKWANFPNERKRLFQLLEKTKTANPIFISGDRHLSELSKITFEGKVFYDFTSSGITHAYHKANQNGEANQHRVSNYLTGNENFGIIRIDWSKNPIEIKTESRGIRNQVWFSEVLTF